MGRLFAQAKLAELEIEFRAQIEAVLRTGLKLTHLDWHTLRLHPGPGGRSDIFDLMLGLAREYRLAMRIAGRAAIEKLRELPTGLSEWAIHPGLDSLELLALEPDGNHARQADYDFWTSARAKEIIEEEGIVVMNYRVVQEKWGRR